MEAWWPKILVVGPSRCGKDTFARMLEDITGLPYAGSMSEIIADFFAIENETSREFEMARRHQNRQLWFAKGNELRKNDTCFLLRAGFEKGRILTGARNLGEIQIGEIFRLYDHVLWVDRNGAEKDPTLEYDERALPSYKSWIVKNHGSLDDLRAEAVYFAAVNGLHKKYYSTAGATS